MIADYSRKRNVLASNIFNVRIFRYCALGRKYRKWVEIPNANFLYIYKLNETRDTLIIVVTVTGKSVSGNFRVSQYITFIIHSIHTDYITQDYICSYKIIVINVYVNGMS